MGFELLSVEDGDVDLLDPIYDVFEITSGQQWVPAHFRSINNSIAPKIPLEHPTVDDGAEEISWIEHLTYTEFVDQHPKNSEVHNLPPFKSIT